MAYQSPTRGGSGTSTVNGPTTTSSCGTCCPGGLQQRRCQAGGEDPRGGGITLLSVCLLQAGLCHASLPSLAAALSPGRYGLPIVAGYNATIDMVWAHRIKAADAGGPADCLHSCNPGVPEASVAAWGEERRQQGQGQWWPVSSVGHARCCEQALCGCQSRMLAAPHSSAAPTPLPACCPPPCPRAYALPRCSCGTCGTRSGAASPASSR